MVNGPRRRSAHAAEDDRSSLGRETLRDEGRLVALVDEEPTDHAPTIQACHPRPDAGCPSSSPSHENSTIGALSWVPTRSSPAALMARMFSSPVCPGPNVI